MHRYVATQRAHSSTVRTPLSPPQFARKVLILHQRVAKLTLNDLIVEIRLRQSRDQSHMVAMRPYATLLRPMPKVGLTEAARLTGKHKSTIARAAKDGRLSSTNDSNGDRVFDTAELERVFGLMPQGDGARLVARQSQSDYTQPMVRPLATPELEQSRSREIALLEKQVRMLEEDRDRWIEQATHWRQQATALLADQRSQKEKEESDTRHPHSGDTGDGTPEVVAAMETASASDAQNTEPKVEETATNDDDGSSEESAPAMRSDVVGVVEYPPRRRSWWRRLFPLPPAG